jgi:hypothetical protein
MKRERIRWRRLRVDGKDMVEKIVRKSQGIRLHIEGGSKGGILHIERE